MTSPTQLDKLPEPQTLTLRPPTHRVAPRAVAYWTVRAAAGWLLFLALQAAWAALDGRFSRPHVVVLVVTLLLAAAHLLIMPRWRYLVHRWETTPEALYTQSGWVTQERRIAPASRIQTVDSHRGPFEQLFGLANVTVTTASAAGPLRVHGLDRDTAQQLVDELTSAAQITPGDAT